MAVTGSDSNKPSAVFMRISVENNLQESSHFKLIFRNVFNTVGI